MAKRHMQEATKMLFLLLQNQQMRHVTLEQVEIAINKQHGNKVI